MECLVSNQHAIQRVTKPVHLRINDDDEMARSLWIYRIKNLRGDGLGCVTRYNELYLTEAERPAIEEKNRLETERQRAIVYKQSDTELSRHINFNE